MIPPQMPFQGTSSLRIAITHALRFTLLSAGLILPSLRGICECSTQHAAITRAARPRCVDTPGFWENAMLVSKAVGEDGLLAEAPSMGKEGLLEMSPSTGKEGLQTVAVCGKEGLQTVAVCVILGCWLLGAVLPRPLPLSLGLP